MPIFSWIIAVFSLSWAGLYFFRHRKLAQRMAKLQEALRAAKVKIYNLEEEHLQKEVRREGTEEKLRGYLLLLDALINTIPNPIYFKDEKGVYQGCNNVFAENILGLTRDRIIGRRSQELPDQIPPDLAATYQRQEIITLGKGRFRAYEAQVQCADGTCRDFLFSLAPIQNQKGESTGSVTVLSDLTDKNRAADDRLQKEKLEGVLETAGGVCHEFNQPMQALSGYLEILSLKTTSENNGVAYIEKALAQIERMRAITAKLQRITRYETMEYADKTKIIDIHKSSQ